MVGGDLKLHVRTTLMGQLLIIVLKYLASIFLSVEEILHISLRCLRCSTRASRSGNNSREMSDYHRVPPISTSQADIGIPLFFWRSNLFLRTSSSLFACMSCT
jgi:hypothetical protein